MRNNAFAERTWSLITHVVMLSLVDSADRPELIKRLRALNGQIPSLLSLRAGSDALGDTGCADVVLISEHTDADGLNSYQVHPVHQEFIAWVRPRLSGRAVVDTAELG